MATLHLMLSEGFTPASADELARALAPYIRTETPEIYCRKSSDLEALPQFIHAVGQGQLWQESLGESAAVFLNQLGYRAADIAWDEAEHALARTDCAPLAGVAMALTVAKETIARPVSIIVGLNIPNDRFGTVVVIDDSRPVKIAFAIARFVTRADEIAMVIQRAVVTGETPRGPALLSFDDDGSVLIKWNSRADMRPHEARLPLDNERS
jgi:hypothetical protein